ncbi:ABC transporter permease [Ferdinandcohnia quinoae]|uniref:ABC transporter permease n=1 Tax=Fredinandcohnia quinoae TaxID=2918902 RepID=A0AAW5E5P6_9BACI|nr:ABC transporter permease [Fredinandcohnia sp. SECRCQ15]MCH1627673.1 ABC transporter permease [Fredinandcohnia sp. SECRCQ15]
MSSLVKLIQNENMKNFRRISTWIMIGILIVATIGLGIIMNITANLSDSDNQSWEKNIQQQNEMHKADIANEDFPEMTKDYSKRQLAINEYRLEHNIAPIESTSMWSFMSNAAGIVSLITLFTIIVGASSVASEFTWGTIKLLLIRPVSRSKILLSKYIGTILFALISLVVLFIISFLVGGLFFGFDGSQPHLVYRGGAVHEVNMIWHILGVFGLKSVDLIMMSTFAFMISTVFRNSGLAIGLAIFLMFAGVNATVLLAMKFDWAKYILFANTDLSQYLTGEILIEGMTMTFSIIVLVIYFVVFNALSWLVFTKRDVAA